MLPLSAVKQLLKTAGASRTSRSAVETLRMLFEKEAKNAANRAAIFAKHAGRKTIKAEDVTQALRQ
ncbi:NFYB/HAP3 family transcription factor subunit [Candidatus Woesearchaeota archaeon]|nr:NFYB/HAP3 family transcription factor subunit [Candidatus Woesearchaeota archaeon]